MVYYCDGYTSYYGCNDGLGYGARAGIGVGIAAAVIIIIILFSLLAARRRRRRFTQQPAQTIPMSYQNNQPTQYYQGYNSGYGAQPSPYGQTGQAYGPPPGAPPANDDAALYAPPVGAPPPAYVPRDERKTAETPN